GPPAAGGGDSARPRSPAASQGTGRARERTKKESGRSGKKRAGGTRVGPGSGSKESSRTVQDPARQGERALFPKRSDRVEGSPKRTGAKGMKGSLRAANDGAAA